MAISFDTAAAPIDAASGHVPHAVYKAVLSFFVERCDTDEQAAADRARPGRGLLRTACVGNPERTIQGELFAYLKSHFPNVVLEYRLHSFGPAEDECWEDGRSVDIMVLDEAFLPACAIELKHLGRVQRHIGYLLKGLQADQVKYAGIELPLVQVGVYTDLEKIPDARREAFSAFRFISCYAFDKKDRLRERPAGCDATAVTGHSDLLSWARAHCHDLHRLSFRGLPETFTTPAGEVSGRVHYFVGLTKDPSCTGAL
jgi:hypothetical protein